MEAKFLNKNNIVSIEVYNRKETDNFSFKEEHKLFFGLFTDTVEGFYERYGSSVYSITEIEDLGYLVEGTRVYKKPKVKVLTCNKSADFTVHFDTLKEAMKFAKDLSDQLGENIIEYK